MWTELLYLTAQRMAILAISRQALFALQSLTSSNDYIWNSRVTFTMKLRVWRSGKPWLGSVVVRPSL